MTWKPNIVTRQAIQGFISDLFATAPEIMGIDEAIAGCEVILMDPYTTGALPRYIRVRIREYYQDVMWRGTPNLTVGDFCVVLHFRDGNRYEVIGASGATGVDLAIPPYTYVWVYDVSEGLLISYDTINGALGYAPLAAGDFILIPPGTFNESVTLVNGVFICEQIPGTVTLDWSVNSGALTTGTVIVADGGYINVRNIYRSPAAGVEWNAVYVPAGFAAACTIIAENIRSQGSGNSTYGIYNRATGGTLHVHAKTLTAITTGANAGAYYAAGAGGNVVNLYIERGYASATVTRGWGIRVNGETITIYGGEWEGTGGVAGYGIQVTASGTLTVLHARAIGSTTDIRNTGGTYQIFQVQYNSDSGTITHLPGDHIVLDLDTDTYITALAADDRIDLFVAGAPPTDFKFGPNNVITVLDNIAQAFSIVDAGGLEYMRIVSTNANPYFLIDPAGAGINVGVGTAVPGNRLTLNTVGADDALPALGANGGKLGIFRDVSYGMLLGQLGTGNAFIQVQRIDGTPTAYDLLLNPSGGGVGIGTVTIPHAGVGIALLALDGVNTHADGPHMQFTTASDNYPILSFVPWSHDSVNIAFDAYYPGAGAWESSDAGSNFLISKVGDKLKFQYDSGVAAGAAIGWNDGIVLLTSGNVGIGVAAPAGRLHVDQLDPGGILPVLYLDQADVDREFIRFVGTAAAGNLTRSLVDEGDQASETREGWIKIYIIDVGGQVPTSGFYIPIYSLA